jgi:phosphoserine phosphatase
VIHTSANSQIAARSPSASDHEPPLCVDLDGTLIAGDTLALSVTALMRRRPWSLVPAMLALVTRGRAAFKCAVAKRYQPDAAALPWHPPVLEFLQRQRGAGRRLVLATAAHREIAVAVARHLAIFEAVIASDSGNNLKGAHKVAAIRIFTGGGAFDYAGDSWADVPVFAAARRSILVTTDQRLIAKARAVGQVEAVIAS